MRAVPRLRFGALALRQVFSAHSSTKAAAHRELLGGVRGPSFPRAVCARMRPALLTRELAIS